MRTSTETGRPPPTRTKLLSWSRGSGVLAEINERDAVVAILNHLGLDPDPPTIARARDPTDDAA
jgi:hypothetical protein